MLFITKSQSFSQYNSFFLSFEKRSGMSISFLVSATHYYREHSNKKVLHFLIENPRGSNWKLKSKLMQNKSLKGYYYKTDL